MAIDRDETKTGDDDAFARLIESHQRELHIHCYRMLGSLDDADDALQETMLRAWKAIASTRPDSTLRAWLYRIATNVSLTMLDKQEQRFSPDSLSDLVETDDMRLDPYPERWLTELPRHLIGPEATVDRDESVRLAFVASVQMLPARQRAALLLQDVLGFPAADVAEMLDGSVPATNSLLQRARSTLTRERLLGRVSREHREDVAEDERAIVDRLVAAWHATDIPAIVAMLSRDAVFTMPPESLRREGPDAIGGFLQTVPAGGNLGHFRLVQTRANHQPAVAIYEPVAGQAHFVPHAVMVIALSGGKIASLVRFAGPGLFERFGLPLDFIDS
jgi:RNA polymerase sigma-70 factor, ECF subfamily